jgi:hypothetical protein
VPRRRRDLRRESPIPLDVPRCQVLYSAHAMTPSAKKQTAFRIEPEILSGLQTVKERDGVPVSEQVRRALRAWLGEKGVGVTKAERKRAATRKRP